MQELIKKLMYNPDGFKYYVYYEQNFPKSYPTFENYLLDNDLLDEYINNPGKIEKGYLEKYELDELHDYDNFMAFCKRYSVFPYQEDKFERKCENCRFSCIIHHFDSTEESLGCLTEGEVQSDYVCDSHVFSFNKVAQMKLTRYKKIFSMVKKVSKIRNFFYYNFKIFKVEFIKIKRYIELLTLI